MEVTRDVVLDAEAGEVWRLLTDEAELSTWLGDDVRLDVRPGGAGVVRDGDRVQLARVDEVVDGRRLVLSWWDEGAATAPSRVVFELEQVGRGTRLTVVETARGGGARCSSGTAWDAWDDRLLGLEARLLARAGALLVTR